MPVDLSPRVSVIIPAFNASRFIRETIESALGQTLHPSEIIVVDDGSTDDTRDIVREYSSRVALYQRQQGGASAARNLGAREASGEWLAFLDADDVWMPTKLERECRLIDGSAALVYCDRINIGDRGDLPEQQGTIQPLYEGDVFVPLLVIGNVITTSSVMLRTDVFRAVGGFCEDPRLLAEDWDLWVRVAAHHQFRACREALIQYRLHAGGMSRRLEQMMAARCLVTERALASDRGRALDPAVKRRVWSETWKVNGHDAVRQGAAMTALWAYLRSACHQPFASDTYVGMMRAVLRA